MMEPLGYLRWGILAGIVFFLLEGICRKASGQDRGSLWKNRRWNIFFCVVYLIVLLNLTYFSREPGTRTGVTVEIFRTWGNTPVEHAFFIENILLFIPFGILFPMVFPALRKPHLCILEGFLFSVCLELMQFVAGRGFCQLDDVVTNTFGAGVGWGIYRLLRWKKRPY